MHHLPFVPAIAGGILTGVLAHLYFAWAEPHQFPTAPHGRIIYVFLGFLAAILGSLAVPALLTADYTAGVFLALGGAQFHTVRAEERKLLQSLDQDAVVPRGNAYIEGLALAMEARNYLVLLIAILVTLLGLRFPAPVAVGAGSLAAIVVGRLSRGRSLGQMTEVSLKPTTDGSVEVSYLPSNFRARAILKTPGQQQAILHDLAVGLGLRLDPEGHPLLPTAEVEPHGETLRVVIHPESTDPERILRAAVRVPVLEAIASPLR